MADLEQLLTDPHVGPSNTMQAEVMRKILSAALFAGAVGSAGRTLQGVGNFLGRNLGSPPAVPLRQSTIDIPVPFEPTAPRRAKRANLAPPASFGKEPLTWLSQQMARGTMQAPGQPPGFLKQQLSGWGAAHPADMPWAYPVGALAIGGGLYGGYKLTDWLLDKTRRHEVNSELEQARREYQEAMLGQYAPPGTKAGATDPVDALYEKTALTIAPALGLGMFGMGALGLASGMGAYNWARSRSRTKALEEAIRRRQEALFSQAPRPIMAVPVPHAVGTMPMPGEDEDEMPKVASLATAADQVLARFQQQKQQALQHWQTLINGPPKGNKQQKSQEPQAPQLPTLAGSYTRGPVQPNTPS